MTDFLNLAFVSAGHTCACQQGYTGDGYAGGSGCYNINECALYSIFDLCPFGDFSQCEDTYGSYKCICNEGYIQDLDGTCSHPYGT